MLLLLATGVAGGGPAQAAPSIALESVATGLTQPVGIVHAGDGSGRLFIVEQGGRIRIFDGTQLLSTPFLDIASRVACCGEQGLLGLAFHPSYASNGFFYVNYTNTSGDTVVARYSVSANPNAADPASEAVVLTQAQPFANHNGGQLQFGPDGKLYISLGDGGSGGDPGNRAQDLSTLLGKILRIDVDAASPYAVPAGNPFAGTAGARGEIWAYGLRNPWRFTFDRETGDMFIGDVGQNLREEIDFQPASSGGGENYGWRRMEGSLCFNPASGCNDGTLKLPIIEYGHESGNCSVTGGFRYRGARFPQLLGFYFYGDYCSGRLWGAVPDAGGAWTSTELLDSSLFISSFGEDERGEIYVADHVGGAIHRITAAFDPPTVASITPTSGPTAGGTTVTVTGTNFAPGNTTVRFGGVQATGVSVSGSTSLTAVTPAGGAGAVDVMATTPGGSATLASGYTYFAPPTIASIAPNSGPAAGGTTVTIRGTNFVPGSTTVFIGSLTATGVNVTDSATLTATTQSNPAGAADVLVTTPGGSATLASGFNFQGAAISFDARGGGGGGGGCSISAHSGGDPEPLRGALNAFLPWIPVFVFSFLRRWRRGRGSWPAGLFRPSGFRIRISPALPSAGTAYPS